MFINGQERDLTSGMTINELLRDLDIDPKLVVVELNKEIISKENYKIKLKSEDRVEIVSFVGGG